MVDIDTPRFAHILLAQKINWNLAGTEFTAGGNVFAGPDGTAAKGLTLDPAAANVNLFDGRPYKEIHVLWTGTWANANTLEMDILHYTDDDKALASSNGATYGNIAALGGPLTLETGQAADGSSVAANAAFNALRSTSIITPEFFRLKFFASAALGALTAPRLFVYGVRRE